LPEKWSDLIRDTTLIGGMVRKKLAGEYADKKGEYVEKLVTNTIQGLAPYERGQVALVGGKEVDLVVPSLSEPYVMVMVSYYGDDLQRPDCASERATEHVSEGSQRARALSK
jgi:hypothetical protein